MLLLYDSGPKEEVRHWKAPQEFQVQGDFYKGGGRPGRGADLQLGAGGSGGRGEEGIETSSYTPRISGVQPPPISGQEVPQGWLFFLRKLKSVFPKFQKA